jgi:hypothetical protein
VSGSLQPPVIRTARRGLLRWWLAASVMLASTALGQELDPIPSILPMDPVNPEVLRPPIEQPPDPIYPAIDPDTGLLNIYTLEPPLGYTGRSGIIPRDAPESSHFIPLEDRWRQGFPQWDRYGRGHPPQDDYPYSVGRLFDPYHQNVLKGDYPFLGQHTFLNLTATSLSITEGRQVPTPTTPFESTFGPGQTEFFGDPDQLFHTHFLSVTVDLFHGDTAFKPFDWRFLLTPVFNFNHLGVAELGIVNPDVTAGRNRNRQDFALQDWFVETKLGDLSADYDFLSMRAGSQLFVSDFRGFIFADTNRAVRLFGTRNANRDQFNLLWFDMQEKDTNSQLNTFDDRHQNVVIANYYRQDFIWPGYTAQASFHYNRDNPSFKFDDNRFLVRPDPAGVFQPHGVDAYYLGWAGDGHINRFNISHAFYWAFGRDGLNPIAGREIDINAQMAAVELSYDRDWARFRTSYFFASGDNDIDDGEGEGFDTILDNPNFAGGQFSYWQRQQIGLFGVQLVNRESLVPDLRSSKIQGQSNFVNPGLHLFNVGIDMDLTPKLKSISNLNFLWFDSTDVLEQFVFQSGIGRHIGTDLSTGLEYRPLLNNNVILLTGISGLLPGEGFDDLYDPLRGDAPGLVAGFLTVQLTY